VVAVIETADPATTPESSAQSQRGRLMELRAPANGTVSDMALARGAFFDVPIQPLMTIGRFDTVWVTASVPEDDVAFVSKGQSIDVRLLAYPGQVFHGRIFFTSDVLDPDTRRMKVRIALPNPEGKLKPGMFANATFLAPPETVATLPTTALVLKNDSDAVFVEVAPWTFEARPIVTQSQQGDQLLIAGGVSPGERVIVRGGVLLND
jgi:cobalt-zinc-cadmium efflux system membrane fusion protein